MKRRGAARVASTRPRRTCLGCGARDDQNRLIRLRVGGRGELVADDCGAGRGGYLHGARDCWEKFVRRKSVYRAFHLDFGKTAKENLIGALKDRYGD
jgi:predicted RNA-binding protein YlxR (DUF448 family)